MRMAVKKSSLRRAAGAADVLSGGRRARRGAQEKTNAKRSMRASARLEVRDSPERSGLAAQT